MYETLQGIMTTTYQGTYRMIVAISKEELAFLKMYPPQIKLGLIGFTAGFKKITRPLKNS